MAFGLNGLSIVPDAGYAVRAVRERPGGARHDVANGVLEQTAEGQIGNLPHRLRNIKKRP
jgi:hypothetical protein